MQARKFALGWSFKKDTNDTRESAAIYVADLLLEEMASIDVFDPKVSEKQILNDFLKTRDEESNKDLLNVNKTLRCLQNCMQLPY